MPLGGHARLLPNGRCAVNDSLGVRDHLCHDAGLHDTLDEDGKLTNVGSRKHESRLLVDNRVWEVHFTFLCKWRHTRVAPR